MFIYDILYSRDFLVRLPRLLQALVQVSRQKRQGILGDQRRLARVGERIGLRRASALNPYVNDNRFTLRNVQVGYTFPLWKVAGLTVIASGENLVRYTSAHGNIGYSYPCARTFTLALRLQL